MTNIALMIIYAFVFIGLLIVANKHGEQREDYNFWVALISNILSLVLIWWALGWIFI